MADTNTKIKGYNVVLQVNEKIFAGTTSNTLNIVPKVKESLTKEDLGTTSAEVTGYDSEITIDGIVEVNGTTGKTTRVDRNDIIDMTTSGNPVPFSYGGGEGVDNLTGTGIVTNYSETTTAEGEATYSATLKGISKLKKVSAQSPAL